MKPSNKKPASHQGWITFNVGGCVFATTRLTLIKGTPPNSPLHRVSNGSTNVEWDRDESGAYLIDRDPMFFQVLLNYLRYNRLILSRFVPEEAVLMEAEYFGVPELAKEMRQRTSSRQTRNRFTPKFPHHYHQPTEMMV